MYICAHKADPAGLARVFTQKILPVFKFYCPCEYDNDSADSVFRMVRVLWNTVAKW